VPTEEAARRRRVLVVDDSITVREVERQLLKKHGYALWDLWPDRKGTFVEHYERIGNFHHPRHLEPGGPDARRAGIRILAGRRAVRPDQKVQAQEVLKAQQVLQVLDRKEGSAHLRRNSSKSNG